MRNLYHLSYGIIAKAPLSFRKCLTSLSSSAINYNSRHAAVAAIHTDSTVKDPKPSADSADKDDELYRYLWIKCRSHEVEVLDSYERFLKTSAEHLDINYVRTETPFRVIKRKTLLASRFVKKKYRVQYEVRTYFRDLLFKNLTGSTVDTFLEYTQRNLPEGVMMIAEKHRLAELPFELTSKDDLQPSEEERHPEKHK